MMLDYARQGIVNLAFWVVFFVLCFLGLCGLLFGFVSYF